MPHCGAFAWRRNMTKCPFFCACKVMLACSVFAGVAAAAGAGDPPVLRPGQNSLPTSLFGTYLQAGDFLVYPFYEYETNKEEEYKPSELGFVGDEDLFGEATKQEFLLYLGYGITDRLAVEFEAALYVTEELLTAPEDTSLAPDRIEESGIGEIEVQVRWQWLAETSRRPQLYSFVEVEPPNQRGKQLIGAQEWKVAVGFGVIKDFSWGTMLARLAPAYEGGEGGTLGEYAFEFQHRVSPRFGYLAGLEGEDDEVLLVGELQWAITPRAVLKLNSGFGLTEKASDFAPEVGVVWSF